jgi:hypothetical protein
MGSKKLSDSTKMGKESCSITAGNISGMPGTRHPDSQDLSYFCGKRKENISFSTPSHLMAQSNELGHLK